MIASDRFTDQETAGRAARGLRGLLRSRGFRRTGCRGMLEAIRWAREHKLPSSASASACKRDHRVCPHRLKIADTIRASSRPSVRTRDRTDALPEGIQEMGGTMRWARTPAGCGPAHTSHKPTTRLR